MMDRIDQADPRKLPSQVVQDILVILYKAERDISPPYDGNEDDMNVEDTNYLGYPRREEDYSRIPGAFLPYMRGRRYAWMGGSRAHAHQRHPAMVVHGGNGMRRMNVEYLRR